MTITAALRTSGLHATMLFDGATNGDLFMAIRRRYLGPGGEAGRPATPRVVESVFHEWPMRRSDQTNLSKAFEYRFPASLNW